MGDLIELHPATDSPGEWACTITLTVTHHPDSDGSGYDMRREIEAHTDLPYHVAAVAMRYAADKALPCDCGECAAPSTPGGSDE